MKLIEFAIERRSVRAVQKNKCWICGRFMKRHYKNGCYSAPTIDHVYIPRKLLRYSVGIKNNSLYACAFCNSVRGDSELDTRMFAKARMLHIAAIAYQLAK
jgi:hypothetical protein